MRERDDDEVHHVQPDGSALVSPAPVAQVCAQLCMNLVGVDEIDAASDDVLNSLLDLS
jgi:hypothetical protein